MKERARSSQRSCLPSPLKWSNSSSQAAQKCLLLLWFVWFTAREGWGAYHFNYLMRIFIKKQHWRSTMHCFVHFAPLCRVSGCREETRDRGLSEECECMGTKRKVSVMLSASGDKLSLRPAELFIYRACIVWDLCKMTHHCWHKPHRVHYPWRHVGAERVSSLSR